MPGDLEHSASGLLIGGAHGGHHVRERDPEAAQAIRVDLHLVLAHEAADRRNLRDPRHAGERVAQVPILETAQLGEIMFAAAIDERVLEDPAHAGRVGPERRRDAFGQAPDGGAHVLEHAAAGPVEIRAVLEDHVHEGEPEERLPAHVAHARRREQHRRDRVGDLILDERRTPARPLAEHDHLDVREIGNRVEGRVQDRVDAPGERRRDAEERESAPARAGGHHARDQAGAGRRGRAHHCDRADASRLSEATRKFPEADHRLAGREPREHLVDETIPGADFDLTGREAPLAAVDEHDAPRAGVEHGRGGHQQPFAPLHAQLDVRVHVRQQPASGIRELDANATRARVGIEGWIDIGDRAVEILARERGQAHARALADRHQRQLRLRERRVDPDAVERARCDRAARPARRRRPRRRSSRSRSRSSASGSGGPPGARRAGSGSRCPSSRSPTARAACAPRAPADRLARGPIRRSPRSGCAAPGAAPAAPRAAPGCRAGRASRPLRPARPETPRRAA